VDMPLEAGVEAAQGAAAEQVLGPRHMRMRDVEQGAYWRWTRRRQSWWRAWWRWMGEALR